MHSAVLIGSKLADGDNTLVSTAWIMSAFNILAIAYPALSVLELPFLCTLSYSFFSTLINYSPASLTDDSTPVTLLAKYFAFVTEPLWYLLEGFFTCFCIQGSGQLIQYVDSRLESPYGGKLAFVSLSASLATAVVSGVYIVGNVSENAILMIAALIWIGNAYLNFFQFENCWPSDVGVLALYILFNVKLISSAGRGIFETIWLPFPFTISTSDTAVLIYRFFILLVSAFFIRVLAGKSQKERSFNSIICNRFFVNILWTMVLSQYLVAEKSITGSQFTYAITLRYITIYWSLAISITLTFVTSQADIEIWQDSFAAFFGDE